ncbi:class I SAM-dependent DNA methyltransferase [Qipengyuania thermophila]|uniref:class I SAM-dependent DNA methyltransferase n=1 Tax=Qipengyuania thermophila TaxID=2509361 RepID=UPI0013EB5F43|nr:SAM-dependent methyltransferase [Qipengyuania thermophila]
MSNSAPSRRAVFDALYAGGADPWQVTSSAYEQEKYAETLNALPDRRFAHGLEIGCGIGVLSARLLERCGSLTAIDVSPEATARARVRLGGAARVLTGEVPGDWPAGSYDLVVLSEILYFLDAGEVETAARLTARDLQPGGCCLLVNWTGPNECALDGDEAAELFLAAFTRTRPGARHGTRHERYRIDRLLA